MSSDEGNFKSVQSEKRSSSNHIVTAWEVYSTLNNMEDFIRFIEQFETQKQQLQNILPFIQRMKKVHEQKEFFSKQISQLGKLIYPLEGNQKQQQTIKSQKKQKNPIEKHFQLLQKTKKEILNISMQNSKRVGDIKNRIKESKSKRQLEIIEKKEKFSFQLVQNMKNKINSIQDRINQQNFKRTKRQTQTLHGQAIQQYITLQLSSDNFLDQAKQLIESQISRSKIESQQSDNKQTLLVKNYSVKSDLEQKFNELGQIKCKLFSLQDKKRKITVKNLMTNKIPNIKQFSDENQLLLNKNKKFKVIKIQSNNPTQLSQKSKIKVNKQNGLFGSFLSIFSSDGKDDQKECLNSKNQQKKEQQGKDILSKKELSSSQKKMELRLQQIEDKEVKLKIAEIHAQILQLREQVHIMINQNILDQVLCSIMKLKYINEQLVSYINELKRVIMVIRSEKKMQQMQGNIQILKDNQEINFFLNFIKQRLIARENLIKFLFGNIVFSISVAKKYVAKRLGEIQCQFQVFIESSHSKDEKIKTVQKLQAKPQFHLINSGLETLALEINEILQNKLIPLQKLLKNQSFERIKISQNLNRLFNQNQTIGTKINSEIISQEINFAEKIVFLTPQSFNSKNYEQLFDFYIQLSRKILDIIY